MRNAHGADPFFSTTCEPRSLLPAVTATPPRGDRGVTAPPRAAHSTLLEPLGHRGMAGPNAHLATPLACLKSAPVRLSVRALRSREYKHNVQPEMAHAPYSAISAVGSRWRLPLSRRTRR